MIRAGAIAIAVGALLWSLAACRPTAPVPPPPAPRAPAPDPTPVATPDPPPPDVPPPPPATPLADPYREVATRILAHARADRGGFAKLRHLTDRIGHRLSGSAALDRAIAWAADAMRADGHDVRLDPVLVPHWERGAESARIVAPVTRDLVVLGLGGSVGTPRRGVTAPVVVVRSWDELAAKAAAVKGAIVLYDVAMPTWTEEEGSGYGKVVRFRGGGASAAAKLGAVAVFVRSVTAHSLRTPHTGAMRYADDAPKIPAAAVTTEDAALLARLAEEGEVKVTLQMGAKMLPDAKSANVLGELRGRERPEEIVLIGAHLDSWDVGQGAHDDGAGVVHVMQALTTLRVLGLVPRRTIRVVLFTNEENGLRGGRGYADVHAGERHTAALETDSGGFAPRGFVVATHGDAAAQAKFADVFSLLAPLGMTKLVPSDDSGADTGPLLEKTKTLGLGLITDGRTYFDIHHTPADTLDKVDPAALADGVAAVAVIAYVLADLEPAIVPVPAPPPAAPAP